MIYPAGHLQVSDVEPQTCQQSQHATVRGESLVAYELPCAVGEVAHGDEHLDEMVPRTEEIGWLVEQAVAQAGTDKHAEEHVEEQRLELFVAELLALVEPPHQQIAQGKSCQPAKRVPAHLEAAHTERRFVGVPVDKQRIEVHGLVLNIEAEVHDVAVLHYIVLAFYAQLSGLADCCFAAIGNVVVVLYHFTKSVWMTPAHCGAFQPLR